MTFKKIKISSPANKVQKEHRTFGQSNRMYQKIEGKGILGMSQKELRTIGRKECCWNGQSIIK